MNQEKQRIAIAEACGWKKSTWAEQGYTKGATEGEIWRGPDKCGWRSLYSDDDRPGDPYPFPDYLNDLNAMHEAEKLFYDCADTLKGAEYMSNYSRILCGLSDYPLHSTAAQRAEAFLKTLSLWTEEE